VDYTRSQLRAIRTIDQNLQIIACAGSGKTEVISRRVVEILRRKKDVGPGSIVAFTYTEKAAGELKDRIHRLCLAELGTDEGLAEMYVGTIHAYCLNLLQQPPAYQFLKYSPLTDVQQRLLIDRNSSKSGLTEVPLLKGGTLKRWQDSKLYQSLIAVLDEGDIPTRSVPKGVRDAVAKYHRLLDEKRYLDFSGMLAKAVQEVKSNARLRSKIKSTVHYLIVDEYQDVNPLQEELIQQIAKLGANLCVVGDDDQTIYQWRGSDVRNIIDFARRYSGVKTERLNENFRSSEGIVEVARGIVEQNPDRLSKKMESAGSQVFKKGDILAQQFKNVDAECQWIARKVKWLVGSEYRDRKTTQPRGLNYSDIAILVRVWKDARPIVDALHEAGIPSASGGMNSLFDTPEVECIREAFYYLSEHKPRDGQVPSQLALKAALKRGIPGLNDKDAAAGVRFLKNIKSRIPLGSDNQLFLQRVFLDLLEAMSVREERIGTKVRPGDVIFFNLGRFSQLISDFEQIHFHSSPESIYSSFASFLEFQAAGYYSEETEEKARATLHAVRVMTVHQAKGMQWPAVFVPCLRRNKFPLRRQGGRSVWHIISELGVRNSDRYKGTVEDERRLFYVALTRAEKYLFCSWSPVPGNQQQQRVSQFFTDLTKSDLVLSVDPHPNVVRRTPSARTQVIPQPLTFSELRYYFACPYQFKLRFLYGFDEPVNRALGYGKSLHDALCEIHSESIQGRIPSVADVPKLVESHVHLPFANEEVKRNAARGAQKVLTQYIKNHGESLGRLEHAEKVIELKLEEGIVVSGRIDLIRRTDTGETAIVDFKSGEDTQPHEMTRLQLQVYAAGYQKATGKDPHLVEIHNLEVGHTHREEVSAPVIKDTLGKVVEAGVSIRSLTLPKHNKWCAACNACNMAGLCRSRPASARVPTAQ